MLDFQKDFVKFCGVLVIVVLLVFQDCDFAKGIEVNVSKCVYYATFLVLLFFFEIIPRIPRLW